MQPATAVQLQLQFKLQLQKLSATGPSNTTYAVFSVELTEQDIVVALAVEIRDLTEATREHPMITRSMPKRKPKLANDSDTEDELEDILPPSPPATPGPDSPTPARDNEKSSNKYKLQSPAENLELLTSLMDMILHQDLTSVTPAHIFAASPPIRMMLTN